jgi:hypothetical protein
VNVSLRVKVAATLILVVAAGALIAQDRFGGEFGGRFKGFSKSPAEHIMNEFEGVPELRSVRGRITEAYSGVGLLDAIFELRSEDPDGKVRGVGAKPDGSFQMHSVPEGVYVFKVTRNGFQSVYGKLKVTKKAPSANILRFELRLGV